MCGFLGFYDPENVVDNSFIKSFITKSLKEIKFRGPDKSSVHLDFKKRIFLGHNRLSIVDLSSAGNQPMTTHCGRYTIVYNGEVYNAPVIRKELEEYNNFFKGYSDTEIILYSIKKWGIDQSVKKFRGMFSLVVFDNIKNTVFMARDRLGIKPLYWFYSNKILFFSSDLRVIKKFKNFKKELSSNAISLYLKYGYIPREQSIFKNVHKLLPGYILEHHKKPKIRKFWDLSKVIRQAKEQTSNSYEDKILNLDNSIDNAVKMRLYSDVDMGCFLSGGIDSSLISYYMQKNSKKKISTFSVKFEDPRFDESQYSSKVAKLINSNHYELPFSDYHVVNLFDSFGKIYDEPFCDSSQIPTTMLCSLTSNHVKVALSGDGGDELFHGYNRYTYANKLLFLINFFPNFQKKIIIKIMKLLPDYIKIFIIKYFSGINKIERVSLTNKLNKFEKIFFSRSAHELYENLVSIFPELNIKESIIENLKTSWDDTLNQSEIYQVFDLETYLPDDLLVKVDRASMYYSLEVRVPFLDHKVLESAWNFDFNEKVNKSMNKVILRKLLKEKIPQYNPQIIKSGFGIDINSLLRNQMSYYAIELIESAKWKDFGIKKTFVQKLWNQHTREMIDNGEKIWSLLSLAKWYENYKLI